MSEEKVNKLLLAGVDIEAKWREENKEEIKKAKGVCKYCKEVTK